MDRHANAASDGGLATRPSTAMVWGRAGVLGAVAMLAGTVSHATAGGLLPGLMGMALLFGSCVLGSALLLLRRASAPALALMVLGGQTWVHGVLSAAGGHVGEQRALQSAGVPLPVQGQGTLLEQYRSGLAATPGPGQDWLLHQVDHFVAQGPLMLAAHLGGALVLGLFLAVGEESLWALLRLASVRVAAARRRSGLLAVDRAARLGTVADLACRVRSGPQRPAPQVLPRATLSHRGPPFVLAA